MDFQRLVAYAAEKIVGYLEEDAAEAVAALLVSHASSASFLDRGCDSNLANGGCRCRKRFRRIGLEVGRLNGVWFPPQQELVRSKSEVTWRLMLCCFGTRSEVFHRTRHNGRGNLELVKPMMVPDRTCRRNIAISWRERSRKCFS